MHSLLVPISPQVMGGILDRGWAVGAVRHSTRWRLVQLYTAGRAPPSLGSGPCSSPRPRLVEPVRNLLHRRIRTGLPAIGKAGSSAIRVTGCNSDIRPGALRCDAHHRCGVPGGCEYLATFIASLRRPTRQDLSSGIRRQPIFVKRPSLLVTADGMPLSRQAKAPSGSSCEGLGAYRPCLAPTKKAALCDNHHSENGRL
jgi:hypothetical protein